VRKLNAKPFARIKSDLFYRYNENRPIVNIREGNLEGLSAPGGSVYAVQRDADETDLVILMADEPDLQWFHFIDQMLSLCEQLGVESIITLGSMYDNVLHSDRIISAIASTEDLRSMLKENNISLINYHGPSAIHSVIQSEGPKRGFRCMSLWCHCPQYLQGSTHYGLLSHLGSVLSSLGGFKIDTEELDASWKHLNGQIQALVEKSPELQTMINELRKAKVRGSWESIKDSDKKGEKVINLRDFLEPK
jgi:proteasome assembly chaperone (PAC2) family protein